MRYLDGQMMKGLGKSFLDAPAGLAKSAVGALKTLGQYGGEKLEQGFQANRAKQADISLGRAAATRPNIQQHGVVQRGVAAQKKNLMAMAKGMAGVSGGLQDVTKGVAAGLYPVLNEAKDNADEVWAALMEDGIIDNSQINLANSDTSGMDDIDLPDDLKLDPDFTSEYVHTSGWRGYTKFTPKPGTGWKEVDGGWFTGMPDDTVSAMNDSERFIGNFLPRAADAIKRAGGQLKVIIAPTSNVFSTAHDIFVRGISKEAAVNILSKLKL